MSILALDYLMVVKMTRTGLICVLTFLVFATSCIQDRKPSGVLTQEEYVSYLVKIYVAEAKINTMSITPDSAQQLFQPYEKALSLRYGSDSIIHKTYQYYLAHPDKMEVVYTAVIDSLNLMEQQSRTEVK